MTSLLFHFNYICKGPISVNHTVRCWVRMDSGDPVLPVVIILGFGASWAPMVRQVAWPRGSLDGSLSLHLELGELGSVAAG